MSKFKKFVSENKEAIAITALSGLVVGVSAVAIKRSFQVVDYRQAYDHLFEVIRDLGSDPEELLKAKYIDKITETMMS